MVTYTINANTIAEMAGGYIDIDRVEEGPSRVAENPFRIFLKIGYFNIGNLEELKGRGFNLLGFGVDEEGKLFIDFDIAQ